jgi:hypothetical protein
VRSSQVANDDQKTVAAYRPAVLDVSGPVAGRELTPEPAVCGEVVPLVLLLPAVSPVCPAQYITPTTMNVSTTVIPITLRSESLP